MSWKAHLKGRFHLDQGKPWRRNSTGPQKTDCMSKCFLIFNSYDSFAECWLYLKASGWQGVSHRQTEQAGVRDRGWHDIVQTAWRWVMYVQVPEIFGKAQSPAKLSAASTTRNAKILLEYICKYDPL